MNTKVRLKSLDALRGFDMLFIMGLAELVIVVCNLLPCGATGWLAGQMDHVEWHGLAHHDTIFPLFLFIAGISFPFSIDGQKAAGKSDRQIYLKIVRRGIVLVLLGFVYNGLFRFDFATMRYASVLGRIGLAWMFAALLYKSFGTKVCIAIAAAILVGYWLLMWLATGSATPYSFDDNLVGAIDRILLPGRLHERTFDPEGLFSTLPAIVTALLGMFTGQFVRQPAERFSGTKKTVYMIAAAALLLVAGCVWSYWFPLNKKLWTSTFVCVVGSYSLLMFALFYYIIDVKGFARWSFFFRVVGLNSITIYLAQQVIGFHRISDFFLSGIVAACPDVWGQLISVSGYVAVCWLFLYFLYRQRVFLKV
jgi:predicted acyltransferase